MSGMRMVGIHVQPIFVEQGRCEEGEKPLGFKGVYMQLTIEGFLG